MKIQIYSAITANKDINRNDIPIHTGQNLFFNPCLEAKIYKILGHLYYPNADILIWVDGNIKPNISLSEIVLKYLGNNDLSISKHPFRNCIYKEFDVLLNDPKFKNIENKLKLQRDYYKSLEFPINFGLWECNFIVRRNIEPVNNLFNDWWAQICRFQQRDQVSFPVVLKKHLPEIKFKTLELNDIRKNSDFNYINHNI